MVIVVRVTREKRSWAEDRSKMDKVRGVGATDRAVFVQGEQVDCSGARCAFSRSHRFRVKFSFQNEKLYHRYNNGGTNHLYRHMLQR